MFITSIMFYNHLYTAYSNPGFFTVVYFDYFGEGTFELITFSIFLPFIGYTLFKEIKEIIGVSRHEGRSRNLGNERR